MQNEIDLMHEFALFPGIKQIHNELCEHILFVSIVATWKFKFQ